MQIYSYLLIDSTYPSQICLMKKNLNKNDVDKVQFDNSINCGYVFINIIF